MFLTSFYKRHQKKKKKKKKKKQFQLLVKLLILCVVNNYRSFIMLITNVCFNKTCYAYEEPEIVCDI